MNKYLKIYTLLFMLPVSLTAQITVDSVLSDIERNNTTLSALRKSVEAEKLGNRTGIYLQNPEAGFSYLWGSPDVIGNRTDINIKQSFDFPTAYGYRRQIADSRNLQADLEYQRQRKDVLLNARLLCADLIYANAVIEEKSNRLAHAQNIADAFQSMFEKGEVSILEPNKAQLNLLNIKKEVEMLYIERNAVLEQLSSLNGGIAIADKVSSESQLMLPSDFDQWYSKAEQNNPALLWLKKEIEVKMQQEKLNRALSLPKASAGYMSEKVVGEHFQGVTIGVSIPLWENKNTVKYAQAQTLALQTMEVDSKLQFYNQIKIQFSKAESLHKTALEYRQLIESSNNAVLLKKALDAGEITLINYLMELSYAYSAMDNLLKSEYELNKALSVLAEYETQ
ncbi:MAG: TolC family protein [Bacteroidales bacterium]|nr:TolC family protein [Bacteroidales bacterium]